MTKQTPLDGPTYPLGETAADQVRSTTNRLATELTLEGVRDGTVGPQDFGIRPETLRAQADIAEQAGFTQLAGNFRRAAELTGMPQEKVLSIYEALRPYRLKYNQLVSLADEIERDYGASENARFIREAAEVYKKRGLA